MEPQTESTEPWVKTNEQFPHYYERETADGDRETVFRTDAAQGMLWHSYKRNADGKVVLHVFHTPQEAFGLYGMDLPPGVEPESAWKRLDPEGSPNVWKKWPISSEDRDVKTVFQNRNGAWAAMTPGWNRDNVDYSLNPSDAFAFFGDKPPADAPPDPAPPIPTVKLTPGGEGTDDCPGVDVKGVLYHGTAIEIDELGIPAAGEDPYWKQHGGDAPSIYLTEDYPTAVSYAAVSRYKCMGAYSDKTWQAERDGTDPGPEPDCEPRVYEVEVGMEDVADCSDLRGPDTDDALKEALPKMAENIREADEKDLDGLIIPATYPSSFRGERALPDAPEFLTFDPQDDTEITGVRRLEAPKTYDGGFVDPKHVETASAKMPKPEDDPEFFEPISKEIPDGVDVVVDSTADAPGWTSYKDKAGWYRDLPDGTHQSVSQNEYGAWTALRIGAKHGYEAWTALKPGEKYGYEAKMVSDARAGFEYHGETMPPDLPPSRPKAEPTVEINRFLNPSDAKGTQDCPAVEVKGKLFHGTAMDLNQLERPSDEVEDPYWERFGSNEPAIYLTEDYPTAVLYADWATSKCDHERIDLRMRQEEGEDVGPIPDCRPRVYEVDVELDKAADCRDLRKADTDEDLTEALPEVSRNIIEASDKDLDGMLIPSTLETSLRERQALVDAPEILAFQPGEDTKIVGERRLGELTPDGMGGKWWEVNTKPLTMEQPQDDPDFFTPVRAEIPAGADILVDAPKLTTRAEVSPTADLPNMESGPACPANNKRKRSVRVSYDVRTKSGKTVRGSAKPTVKVSVPAEIKRFAKKARSK